MDARDLDMDLVADLRQSREEQLFQERGLAVNRSSVLPLPAGTWSELQGLKSGARA